MNSNKIRPWYKQFWPWFLIFIPALSMVLSFTMIHFAYTTHDSLVLDEYYKEGKGINLQLTKIQEARAKGIQTDLLVSNDAIALTFVSGVPEGGEALIIDFQHATLKDKDFSATLLPDASGVYRALLDNETQGKWRVSLHPHHDQWKIQKTLSLPQADPFQFNP